MPACDVPLLGPCHKVEDYDLKFKLAKIGDGRQSMDYVVEDYNLKFKFVDL